MWNLKIENKLMEHEVDWLRVYRYFMREEGEEDAYTIFENRTASWQRGDG